MVPASFLNKVSRTQMKIKIPHLVLKRIIEKLMMSPPTDCQEYFVWSKNRSHSFSKCSNLSFPPRSPSIWLAKFNDINKGQHVYFCCLNYLGFIFILQKKKYYFHIFQPTQTHLCGSTSKRFTTSYRQPLTPGLLEASATASLGRWPRGWLLGDVNQQF